MFATFFLTAVRERSGSLRPSIASLLQLIRGVLHVGTPCLQRAVSRQQLPSRLPAPVLYMQPQTWSKRQWVVQWLLRLLER